MPLVLLLLFGLDLFALGALVALWAVFGPGWMGGDDPMHTSQ
jgi:hypothetical protein